MTVNINSESDWREVEAKAYAAEHPDLAHLLEVKPVPADEPQTQLEERLAIAAKCLFRLGQTHEQIKGYIDLALDEEPEPKFKPVPAPTVGQQLAFATIRCAELQANQTKLTGLANEALLWVSMGETERAKQILARIILGDL